MSAQIDTVDFEGIVQSDDGDLVHLKNIFAHGMVMYCSNREWLAARV